ncbi:hypothetical protein BH23ACT3_BH23ACT3_22650 [soil metagenome]
MTTDLRPNHTSAQFIECLKTINRVVPDHLAHDRRRNLERLGRYCADLTNTDLIAGSASQRLEADTDL